jgi:uncharacterized protein (TIGR03437 family)
VQATQPAFFPWPDGYVVATRADYTYAIRNGEFSGISTSPAKPGEVIILWGTGFGATQPAAPAGVAIPPTQTYSTASPVMVTVGGIPATVYAAVLSPGAAALYQLAVQIPSSLGSGDYPVIATVSGASSPASAMITVQQ